MIFLRRSFFADPLKRRHCRPLPRPLLAMALFAAGIAVPVRAAAPAAPPSLLTNGGFEKSTEGWGWMTANGAPASGTLDTTEKHEGRNSYRLSGDFDQAPNVYGRLYRTVFGLRPFTTYRIRVWAKGKGVGIAWFGGGPGWYHRAPFPIGDFDWQEFTSEYATGAEGGDFELMALVESHTGALWIDDFSLTEVRADTARRDAAENAARTSVADERAHLARLRAQVETNHSLRNDRYITLGLAVAERFLTRLEMTPSERKQGGDWDRLQVAEVKTVLDETEKRLTASPLPDMPVPLPFVGKVVVRNGLFETESGGKRVPYFWGGYGHFGGVASDVFLFPALGASLIQQERGPSSSLDPVSDTLLDGGRSLVPVLDDAARSGIKVDMLLSPHYFPDWAAKKAPEVLNGNPGFIGFNIDHPVSKSVTERHLRNLLTVAGKSPALLSLCLSNEPIYSSSGRDKYSLSLWTAFLRKTHGTVEAVNRLYGTTYKRFEDVPVPPGGMPKEAGAQRAYFDWVRFNQAHFADWHKGMSDLCHQFAPGVPTHAKIMVFNTFNRSLLPWGVDPELFCAATDLAGCDAYSFFRGDLLARFERGDTLTPGAAAALPGDYVYDWLGNELYYDLLHSFRGQPVFNSENHIIPDNSPAQHVPPAHTRAAFWQGALHHQGATTTWVWEDGQAGGLAGSIYFRPANIYAEGRALLDANRLSKEVAAINRQTPSVGILYSQPSIFWEADYGGQVARLYAALRFQGQAVTFVSERQLQSGTFPPLTRILVPHATAAADTTVAALARFARKRGNKVVFVGTNCLAFDEYHRPRTLPDELASSVILPATADSMENKAAFVETLREALSDGKNTPPALTYPGTSQSAWGIEYAAAAQGKTLLVPLMNFLPETQIVHLEIPGVTTALDLLSGETIDLSRIRLGSIEPRLLQIGK